MPARSPIRRSSHIYRFTATLQSAAASNKSLFRNDSHPNPNDVVGALVPAVQQQIAAHEDELVTAEESSRCE
jgi:hypothetical protein